MKQLLALLCLLLPAVTWAQSQKQADSQPAIEQTLSGSANVHIVKLAQRTVLYKHLRDTLTNHYARTVRVENCVIIRASNAHWVTVHRAQSTTRFSSDTATYYMPLKALQGAQTYVLL
jgi:hypothetical protein